jgi:hypothetical protein
MKNLYIKFYFKYMLEFLILETILQISLRVENLTTLSGESDQDFCNTEVPALLLQLHFQRIFKM